MKPAGGRRAGAFKKAISQKGQINLIAEVKKASPSAGLIRKDFNAAEIAGIYVKNKAYYSFNTKTRSKNSNTNKGKRNI